MDNRVLWLPDVFGYSGALPQLMKKCGIDYFMTTKLAWNQFNKHPYDTFLWRGIDAVSYTHLSTPIGRTAAASLFQSVCCCATILLANFIVSKIDPDSAII